MLKKFFISMLGSMAALWLSLFIFIVGLFFTISIIIAKNMDPGMLTSDSILHIKLTGDITERAQTITVMDVVNGTGIDNDALDDILSSIDHAATDDKIKGIYLECAGSTLGIASRSELIDALKRFKKSGKWIYAYSDNYTQGDYYVASVADATYLNPVGLVEVKGLSTMVLFFTDVLEKLGVSVDVVKVGSYKSAVEPFCRMDMSEPSKEQTKEYIDQLWGIVSGTIAANRGVEPEQVSMWADSMAMAWAPQLYLDNKVVSELKYRSEVEDAMRTKLGLKAADKLPLVTPTDYMAMKVVETEEVMEKPHVAVYYAFGDIVDDGTSGIVGDKVVTDILALAKDDNVKGLVLRVNSGGGSAFASEQIWHALEDFKKTGKPFYVSMGDYAASGGYYISSGANVIYADDATLTGSIGIFGLIPNAQELVVDKIGLGVETVSSSPNATFPSLLVQSTPEQIDAMQGYVERGYETFVSRVAQGRDLPVDSVKALGGGRVWTGMAAVRNGLVDQIGTLDDAVKAMSGKVGLDNKAVVAYPHTETGVLDLMLKYTMGDANLGIEPGALSIQEFKEIVTVSQNIKHLSPLQARMPYIIIK